VSQPPPLIVPLARVIDDTSATIDGRGELRATSSLLKKNRVASSGRPSANLCSSAQLRRSLALKSSGKSGSVGHQSWWAVYGPVRADPPCSFRSKEAVVVARALLGASGYAVPDKKRRRRGQRLSSFERHLSSPGFATSAEPRRPARLFVRQLRDWKARVTCTDARRTRFAPPLTRCVRAGLSLGLMPVRGSRIAISQPLGGSGQVRSCCPSFRRRLTPSSNERDYQALVPTSAAHYRPQSRRVGNSATSMRRSRAK